MSLKEVLKKNEYPQFFIDNCIKNYLSKLFLPKRVIHIVTKKSPVSFTFFRSFIF